MRFRPLLWPTLFTIPAVIVLLALGTWQVQRLQWKLDLIATIEAAVHQPPIPLPANGSVDVEALQYRPVTVRGRFLHEKEMHLLANTQRGNVGYHLITPMERTGGGTVLVNRGWVPADRKDPATRPQSQPAGEVGVTGLLRRPWHQGWFVPDNDLAKNIWFFGDAAAMAQAAGVSAPPFFVEANAEPNPGGLPIGGQTRLNIPNDHLGYAITWYGFALVLIAIYFVYHRREGRL